GLASASRAGCCAQADAMPLTVRVGRAPSPAREARALPRLTRSLTPLTFPFTTKNAHSCPRENGWKRVHLARARLLARDPAGTLERLEMAAQEPGHLADPARAAPRTFE